MWLLYVSCAWVAGIFVGSRASLPPAVISLGVIPFLVIPLLPRVRKDLIAAGLCLFAFVGGALYFPTSLPDEHSVCSYNGRIVEIQGMVKEAPDVRDRYSLLTVSATSVNVSDEEVSGDVLVKVARYPEYHYGDVLRVTGELDDPPVFSDFDYKSYLEHQGIYSVSYYPGIEVVDEGRGFKPLEWLYSFRESLSDSLARALPEPQGSLAQGILLGIRSNIPYSLSQAFSRTGTAHILAISGVHVSIVIGVLLSFLALVLGRHRPGYIWLTLTAVWIYALLTGMNAPVVRAAIMGSLFLLAACLGRQRSAITALAFAAAVMVAVQPGVLWSVSFQLSFLAMAGLIFLYSPFRTLGREGVARLFQYRGNAVEMGSVFSDSLAVTLAAIVAVWPLVAYYFGIASVVGIPATFLALLALPAIIVTSAAVAFVGLFAAAAAQVLGWFAWLVLSYLWLVVLGFDALPSASFPAAVPFWLVMAYYLVLAVLCLGYEKQLSAAFSRLAGRRRIAEDG
jgi:competence protein ComEC